MLGYLFLAISLFAGATKGYCGKQTSSYVNEYKDAMLANTIRMLLCILIGFGMTIVQEGIGAFVVNSGTIWTAVMSGVTSSIFVVTWLISVKQGAYMMLDVFTMLGLIVPLIGSSILFDESIRGSQWLGLAILLVAVLIMCSYNMRIKGKMSLSAVVLLVICGVASGLTDFSQKLFVEQADGISAAVFNFYTYVFSAITLFICYIVMSVQTKAADKQGKHMIQSIKPIFGYILVMSICLFLSSYFKTLAAEHIPSAQLYPLSQGAGLMLSSIMSVVLFHERLSKRAIFGLILAFGALLIINLL